MHPSPAGNRLVALRMIQWLCESDELPSPCEVFERLLEADGPGAAFAAFVGAAR